MLVHDIASLSGIVAPFDDPLIGLAILELCAHSATEASVVAIVKLLFELAMVDGRVVLGRDLLCGCRGTSATFAMVVSSAEACTSTPWLQTPECPA